MENTSVALSVVFISIGVFFILIGYLVRVKKEMGFIAGYCEENVKDRHGLSRPIGAFMIAAGVLSVVIALSVHFMDIRYAIWLFTLIILCGSLITAILARKY